MSLFSDITSPLIGSTNRGQNAEDLYGGVDRKNFDVAGGDQMLGRYQKMQGQQRGPGDSAFYGDQRNLASLLAAEAQGKGVGQQLVRQQAQGAADNALRQQLAMAASARPGMGAMAYRNAAMNAGNAQSAIGGQAAQAGGQMALQAQGQYGNMLQGARDQDLRLMGLNDQRQLELLNQELRLRGMQQQGGQAYEQNRLGRYTGVLGTPTEGEQALGAIAGGAAMAFGKPPV